MRQGEEESAANWKALTCLNGAAGTQLLLTTPVEKG